MKMKIGHLAFVVADMKKAFDFYIGGLGMTHAFSLEREGKPWIEYLRLGDGQFIELFYAGENYQPNPGSYLHLCIEVDDCEAAVKEAAERGIEILTPPRQGSDNNIQAWIRDPDGNRIELMQISPDSPQYANR